MPQRKKSRKSTNVVVRNPRRSRTIEEFVVDIEKDRLVDMELEGYSRYSDSTEIERYVRNSLPSHSTDDQDSFSYWLDRN